MGKPVEGVLVRMADPAKQTTWWVPCTRREAMERVGGIAHFHNAWFREHGIAAEFGTDDGEKFTATETLDVSGLKI